MTIVMTTRFITVIKLAALLTSFLLVGVGALWSADVVPNAVAGEYAMNSFAIMGVLTAGLLVVAALGGEPAGKHSPSEGWIGATSSPRRVPPAS